MDEIKKYHELIARKRQIGEEIRETKKLMHKEFMQEHKIKIRFLDISFILIILFNLGALVITNAMAMKAPKVLYELNPVAAENHGLELHPESRKLMTMIITQMYFWAILFAFYIYNRITLYNHFGIYVLGFVIILYLTVTGFDFLNDFGFWIGRMIYG